MAGLAAARDTFETALDAAAGTRRGDPLPAARRLPQFALESVDVFDDMVGRAADLGFTDVVTHWPRA